jgi:adenylosuccinate synthase
MNYERLAEMTSPHRNTGGVTKMKGNVVSYLAKEYDLLVRSGGPNAGHKVWEPERPYCFHHLPSGSRANPKAKVAIAPGAVLYPPRFLEEAKECNLTPKRMTIDPRAMIIEESDREFEGGSLVGQIGSTGQGVGSAAARRILRNHDGKVRLARDIEEMKPFLKPINEVIEEAIQAGKKIFLEGTQGTALSMWHGPYPYCSSRDAAISGLISECGISPARVNHVIMVCRTYPIRVQSPKDGTSGPMKEEISIEDIYARSGIPIDELAKTETTSTTKKKRRISEFDWGLLKYASFLNSPTDIACTFADYLGIENRKATCFDELTDTTKRFIEGMERATGVPVSLISTRFHPEGIIDRRRW